MKATNFLEELRESGFQVWIEGDRLRCRGTKEPLNPEILGKLKAFKPKIIDSLNKERPEPFFQPNGSLVIPFDSDPKYHYWKTGGMKLKDIGKEFSGRYGPLHIVLPKKESHEEGK
ncbi:MAG: hypothetical protein HN472_16125 [Nitrospina sp.]|nr:hypothetical protein [Nitrospina sp.]